jgi:hypothetical protein
MVEDNKGKTIVPNPLMRGFNSLSSYKMISIDAIWSP